jgi:hypothetical protein
MKDEDITNGYWGDLGLGCAELFIDGDDYNSTINNPYRLVNNIKNGRQHSSITDTAKFLSSGNNNKWLFGFVFHVNTITSTFPNAKIITFKNNEQMVNHRTSFQSIASNKVWNEISPNERVADRVADFTWDTEWLYDVSTTTDGLHELYKLFNLDGWEQAEPFIKEYYHLWCEKNHLPISVKNT